MQKGTIKADLAAGLVGNRALSALVLMIAAIALVDSVLILASGLAAAGASGRIIGQLNLGIENNAAVWWSSATLLLASVLFFMGAFHHRKHRIPLLSIAFLLLVLSLDEMGSLHERIFTGSYWSYVPYGLIGGLMFLYAFTRLYRDTTMRTTAVILFIGFSCYGSVVVQEFFEHNVDWPQWALGLRVSVEEGTELLGTLLCLFVAGRILEFDKSTDLVIPAPSSNSQPVIIAVFLLLLAVGIFAAWKAPLLQGYPGRGNPALWFPMVGFALFAYARLAGHGFWEGLTANYLPLALAISGSLFQTMFIYQQMNLALLIVVTLLVTVGIAITLFRLNSLSFRYLILFLSPLIILVYFGLRGSAFAAFLFSLFSASALLCVQYMFVNLGEQPRSGQSLQSHRLHGD